MRSKRFTALSALAAVLIIGVVFISWVIVRAPSYGGKGGGPAPDPEPIIFAPPISYAHALRLLTDIGLQPSLECTPYAGHYTPGSTLQPQAVWQPVGQKETFSKKHQMWVSPTFSAPLDWRLRIAKIPGVQFGSASFLPCPHVIYGTPPPNVTMPLTSAQAGTYARITFTSSQTYDTALYTVSNVGLGLVNYCYELAEIAANSGTQPSWQFTGQEQQFTQTHTLVVEIETRVTSSLWKMQLYAQPGVLSVEVPYASRC